MHERYKKAMSGVRPSAECTERIMAMTEKKQHRIGKRWIAVAIAAALLLGAVFTANAATDGAVFDGRLLHGLRLYFDGQEFSLDEHEVNVYTTVDENGDAVVVHEYSLPNDVTVRAQVAEDYTSFAVDADDAGEVRIASSGAAEQKEAADSAKS